MLKLKRANWPLYQEKANLSPSSFECMSVNQADDIVTNTIIDATAASIPQTSGRFPRRPKPWWTDDCDKTWKEQNRA